MEQTGKGYNWLEYAGLGAVGLICWNRLDQTVLGYNRLQYAGIDQNRLSETV